MSRNMDAVSEHLFAVICMYVSKAISRVMS